MRKDFLRTPLDIFRISSGFNLRRKHPIHKKIKAHRGVDYAAPRGTPVYASGDGKVIEVAIYKPNGNLIRLFSMGKLTRQSIFIYIRGRCALGSLFVNAS